jgi:hypothetical protein
MSPDLHESSGVLGQKYAYATASLLLGFATFVNLLSLEKAALALAFGWLALRKEPSPALEARRGWARLGAGLGGLACVLVPLFLVLFRERIGALIEALQRMP